MGGVAVTLLAAPLLMAADHADGPTTTADPTADITDVFAWTSSDMSHVNLVMDVFPSATASSMFSDSVQYVFHVGSKQSFTATAETDTTIICTFDASQNVSCWAGGSYVTGNASGTSGITSADGKLQVFAGLRDDPFFFNLDGFKAVAADVMAAAPSLTFDDAGCPQLPGATAMALAAQLGEAADGGAPVDHFAHSNVLAIVVSVATSVVNGGGPILNVWANTLM